LQDSIGINYVGFKNTTWDGLICQRWSRQYPHKHTRTNPDHFPDVTLGEAENYCRNPDREPSGPWCYTTDKNIKYQFCNIPLCG